MVRDYKIDKRTARKVVAVVDKGLSSGLGVQEPGRMCVEAAVCYAMGLPHSDDPPCVGSSVRAFKIALNDASGWPDNKTRAKAMRNLAVAQLGSDQIDQSEFRRIVAEKTIRKIVPIALRTAAKMNPAEAKELEACAVRCEKEGTKEAANAANAAAYAAANAAAYAAANAAAYAAYAAANAAAYAANAAANAAANEKEKTKARLKVLRLSAQIGLEALIELKSPGCKWLDVCD